MARTSYLAPGVYVEEIPSARQPIAGVGTNTAGFIGIVPDSIFCPVSNPDYDPVAAEAAMRLRALPAESPERAKLEATLQRSLDNARARHTELEPQLKAAQTDLDSKRSATAAAKAVFDELNKLQGDERNAKKAEISAAKARAAAASNNEANALSKLGELQTKDKEQMDAISALEAQLGPRPGGPGASAAAPAAPAGAEGAAAAQLGDDDSALLTQSPLRPYFLKEFHVWVDPLDTKLCTNFREYTDRFGNFSAYHAQPSDPAERNPDKWRFAPIFPGHHALSHAVKGFFDNGGTRCFVARIKDASQLDAALEAFKSIDELALLAAPGVEPAREVWDSLNSFASVQENCFAILDSPADVDKDGDLDIERLSYSSPDPALPPPSKDAAYYFPHIEVVDPAKQIQDADVSRQVGLKYRGRTYVPPSGHMAGIYAATDEERGVHKAPANVAVRGAVDLKYYISKPKQELLNPQGVNCIRNMTGNIVVWGARTIGGDRNGEWKYVPVRRLFLYLRKSIDEGTQWVVFEPNDMALWGKIKLNVSAFLTNVWRSGALFGATPEEAFYVKCDEETNPPEVRDVGQVITEIGVAIVRPAEFVIFRITQATGKPA